jgi:hypothetical protein
MLPHNVIVGLEGVGLLNLLSHLEKGGSPATRLDLPPREGEASPALLPHLDKEGWNLAANISTTY